MKIIRGTIIRGEHIGRRLGFPTANFSRRALINKKISRGVYIAEALLGRSVYRALFIVGVAGAKRFKEGKVEIYLLGRRGMRSLYGRRMEVRVYKKIRPLIHYNQKSVIKRRIRRDIDIARQYFTARR